MVEYKRGKENKAADALSRVQITEEEITQHTESQIQAISAINPTWVEELKKTYP